MNFFEWIEAYSTIHQALMNLRPQMAAAAQKVYDAWEQGEDDEYNGGGICQDIAEAIVGVVHQNGLDVDAGTVSAACGEQHVWAVVAVEGEGFEIDIPYSTYETGGGYTWNKIPGVQFSPEDIIIAPVDASDARQMLDNPW